MSRRLMTRTALVFSTIVVLAFITMQPREPKQQQHLSDPNRPPVDEDLWGQPDEYGNDGAPPAHGHSAGGAVGSKQDNLFVKLDSHMPFTTYDGGIPGYSVFSNMYLSGGALMPVSADDTAAAEMPRARAVMSGFSPGGGRPPAGEDRWAPLVGEKLARSHFGKRAVRVPGITYLFNDPPGKAGYLAFYEHFLGEVFVPAARTVAHVNAKSGKTANPHHLLPSRLIFPRCGSGTDMGWRDDAGKNVWFIQHVLPGVKIEEKDAWDDHAASDMPFIFDQIVIVDRGSAHSAEGDTATWGKMNMIVPTLDAPSDFFQPFRDNMISSVANAMPHVGKYQLPIVVYVKKDNTPNVSPASHEAIVAGLKQLTTKAEVHVAQLKSMTKAQKVALLSRASILISLAGDDLFETAWMPPGSTVVELFEKDGFARDYEVFVSMLGHNHITVQGDKVLSEKEWREFGRQRGPQHNGAVDIDADVVVRAVEQELDKLY